MTRMKSLTDHLAAIHARIKENAEKKLAAQPELDLGMDDQAAPEQPQPGQASDTDAPAANTELARLANLVEIYCSRSRTRSTPANLGSQNRPGQFDPWREFLAPCSMTSSFAYTQIDQDRHP